MDNENQYALAIKNPPAIIDLYSTEREAMQAVEPYIMKLEGQSEDKTQLTVKDFCIKLVDENKPQEQWKIIKDYSMHGRIPFSPEEYQEMYRLKKRYADLIVTALKLIYENKKEFPNLFKKIYAGKTITEIRHDEVAFAYAYMDAGVIDYQKGASKNE